MTSLVTTVTGPGREVRAGHSAEMRAIRDLLRRAQQGAAGVVLVDGEPGSGRSWLLGRAADRAARLGFGRPPGPPISSTRPARPPGGSAGSGTSWPRRPAPGRSW